MWNDRDQDAGAGELGTLCSCSKAWPEWQYLWPGGTPPALLGELAGKATAERLRAEEGRGGTAGGAGGGRARQARVARALATFCR